MIRLLSWQAEVKLPHANVQCRVNRMTEVHMLQDDDLQQIHTNPRNKLMCMQVMMFCLRFKNNAAVLQRREVYSFM